MAERRGSGGFSSGERSGILLVRSDSVVILVLLFFRFTLVLAAVLPSLFVSSGFLCFLRVYQLAPGSDGIGVSARDLVLAGFRMLLALG